MPTLGVATIKKKQRERILGGTESRKPILANVKTEVYKRAKGCCESCGENLKKSEGDFHHWRSPKISPTAQTVQFLCPTCHREYGHTIQVVVHRGILRKWKESTIVQLKVKKHPKKKSKVTLKKPKTKKKTTRKKTPNKSKNKKKKKTSTTAYFISK
ncbi:MAG: hypothetical protein NTY91_01975 [Euryarchaeota archaeon]|nr:hypothetical protein [Euryarchaeota archaeon]